VKRMTRFIDLRTEIPGPKSREILERIGRAVARPSASTLAPVAIGSAHGSLMTDVDQNTFIDLTGGIGCLNVGHTHDRVVAAIKDQADRFLHTDFTIVPYETYVELAERLNARFPGGAKAKTMLFNSGAEAVENAVKIARVATGRKAIIAFEGAFHGRTLMAMTLTSKTHPYKAGMGPFAPEVYRAPFPYVYRSGFDGPGAQEASAKAALDAFEKVLRVHVAPEEVAAVIVEPVQGEGGFVVPPAAFLTGLREITQNHGMMLIVDEVQSGFGRTGRFFAIEHAGVAPDLITVAKSIADGMPLSGVIGRAEVMDAVGDSMIGGTFVGNPMGCRAANAVLDAFEEEDLLEKGTALGEHVRTRLLEMQGKHRLIGEVRGLGPMLAIELVTDRATKEPAATATKRILGRALQAGVICLRAGIYDNVIRFLEPLNTPLEVVDEALDVLDEAFTAEERA